LWQRSQGSDFSLAEAGGEIYPTAGLVEVNKGVGLMERKRLKKRYLFLAAMLMGQLVLTGCAVDLPVIRLAGVGRSIEVLDGYEGGFALGEVVGDEPGQKQYAEFVKNYLGEQLSKRVEEQDSRELATENVGRAAGSVLIDGKVGMRIGAEAEDPSEITAVVEVSFFLRRGAGGPIFYSVSLAEEQVRLNDDAGIFCALRANVDEFLSRLFPPEGLVECQLMECKGGNCRRGNEAARKGDYAAALEWFVRAADERLGDDGALYNAAVMSEALDRYRLAEQYYRRALRLKGRQEYVAGLKRVREHLSRERLGSEYPVDDRLAGVD